MNGLHLARLSWPPLAVAVAVLAGVSCVQPRVPTAAPQPASFVYPSPPAIGTADYFSIAVQGQARCVVVYPATLPGLQRPAEALRTYLERVTGAPIRLISDAAPAPGGLAQIHVGDTTVATNTPLALPDLRYGPDLFPNLNGYLVKTVDARTLVIRGLTPRATEFGIVGFLKRFVGVRQYWEGTPGSLGEVVPSRPTLTVPQVEWRDWPYVYSRWISQTPFTPARAPLDFFRRQQTLPCNENYSALLPPRQFAATHPEYFPLQGDKRLVPAADEDSGWQPCVSNPDVMPIMAEALKTYFRSNSWAIAKNAAVNDGGRDCDCAACRAMDAPNQPYARRMSDRYIKFTNRLCEEVGREFPGKHIVFLAYGGAVYPPTTVKPHPMILPVLTVAGQNAYEAWDGWLAVGPAHMGFYFHHNDTLWAVLPKLDLHQSARRIRYAVESGRLRAVYMEAGPHWPLSGLVAYVTSELLWDPRQDVDALVDEFCASFFGPAAGPMRRFYATLEAGYDDWLLRNGRPYKAGLDFGGGKDGFAQFSALSLEQANKAAASLREAATLAMDDAVAAKRVEAVDRLFRLVEPCVESYWTADRLQREAVTTDAVARGVLEDAQRLFALSRVMSNHIAVVLDKTPPELYGAVFSRPGNKRPIPLYEALRPGRPLPEAMAAIRKGTDAVNAWLGTSRNRESARRWWDEAAASISEPELAAIVKTARLAVGSELKPLYRSRFDEVGRRLAPPDLDIQAGAQEIVIDRGGGAGRTSNYLGGAALEEAGARLYAWFPDRTPFTLALTRKDVPGNVFALIIRHLYRGRLTCTAPVTAGSRQVRVSFLFSRNEGQGKYAAELQCRRDGGSGQETVASLLLPGSANAWHEVAATVELPADTRSVTLNLTVERQAADAQCGVANVSISALEPAPFPSP